MGIYWVSKMVRTFLYVAHVQYQKLVPSQFRVTLITPGMIPAWFHNFSWISHIVRPYLVCMSMYA